MRYLRLPLGPVEILLCLPRSSRRDATDKNAQALVMENARAQSIDGADVSPELAELRERVHNIEWYHSIDLGHGLVTPGAFDLRPHLHQYPIPERMDGMRVLDVATFDGFWAFEFERRGAAEVIALDIDNFGDLDMSPRLRRTKSPEFLARKTGEGFRLCHEALNSKVERRVMNIYDLSPDKLGKFDMVFLSDLLLHLHSPTRALENLYNVTSGQAFITDVVFPSLPGRMMHYEGGVGHNFWWRISLGALKQMIDDAGFEQVELRNQFVLTHNGQKRPRYHHAAFVATP